MTAGDSHPNQDTELAGANLSVIRSIHRADRSSWSKTTRLVYLSHLWLSLSTLKFPLRNSKRDIEFARRSLKSFCEILS